MCERASHVCECPGKPEEELELQELVGCLTQVLGTHSGPLEEQQVTSLPSISPGPGMECFKRNLKVGFSLDEEKLRFCDNTDSLSVK